MTDQIPTTAELARRQLGILTEDETAEMLLLTSSGTLATWRSQKTGPQSVKLGKRVFYPINHIGTWINQQAEAQATAKAPDTLGLAA